MQIAQEKCDGKTTCALDATNSFFGGSICKDTRKYMKVEYGCEVGYMTEQGATKYNQKDGNTMTIPCEKGRLEIHWPVVYMSYDQQCVKNPLNRADAYKGIAELCEGKQGCEFKVGPDIEHFHDVCEDRQKQLTVYAKCVVS